jgi:hypothetical protein
MDVFMQSPPAKLNSVTFLCLFRLIVNTRELSPAIADRPPFKIGERLLQALRNISATLAGSDEFSIHSFIDSPCEN